MSRPTGALDLRYGQWLGRSPSTATAFARNCASNHADGTRCCASATAAATGATSSRSPRPPPPSRSDSGVLIWMGFWDFIDTYVVPERWWAKLLMIVFGAIGLFCTRTLYDKEMLHAIRASTGLGERPDAGLLPLHTDSAAPTTPGGEPPPMAAPRCRSATAAASGSGAPHGAVGRRGRGAAAGRRWRWHCCGGGWHRGGASGGGRSRDAPAAAPAAASARAAASEGGAEPARRGRTYFNAPPFSALKCGRALLAIFVGLTLWVGVWDLVDYHLLPAAVAACAAEADDGGPRLGCALVKLGLIALGALGLYCTRSLYGARSKGAAQFQRFQ